jgi:hypothetical protein
VDEPEIYAFLAIAFILILIISFYKPQNIIFFTFTLLKVSLEFQSPYGTTTLFTIILSIPHQD